MIQYKAGYKYQLTKDHTEQLALKPERLILTGYLKLTPNGVLTIRAGYAWDGPSGPAIDTPNFMRASLVHDALYQLMRQGLLDRQLYRKPADAEMKRIVVETKMSPWRRAYTWWGVRRFAAKAASAGALRPIITAP